MEYFPGVAWPADLCNTEEFPHYLAGGLSLMGEVPLPVGPGLRAYRVSAKPTWGSPFVVRLSAAASGWRVTGRRGRLPRDPAADRPQTLVERELCPAEAAAVEQALVRLNLWSWPVLEEDYGVDGAYWLLEGSDAGRFHAVDRRSPKDAAIREWCHLAHELSGLGRDEF